MTRLMHWNKKQKTINLLVKVFQSTHLIINKINKKEKWSDDSSAHCQSGTFAIFKFGWGIFGKEHIKNAFRISSKLF